MSLRRFQVALNGWMTAFGTKRKKQPIEICKPDPATRLTPQHHHLMPQRRILKLKPTFRFEWRSQDGPDEP